MALAQRCRDRRGGGSAPALLTRLTSTAGEFRPHCGQELQAIESDGMATVCLLVRRGLPSYIRFEQLARVVSPRIDRCRDCPDDLLCRELPGAWIELL
jgi:hypothetical protein